MQLQGKDRATSSDDESSSQKFGDVWQSLGSQGNQPERQVGHDSQVRGRRQDPASSESELETSSSGFVQWAIPKAESSSSASLPPSPEQSVQPSPEQMASQDLMTEGDNNLMTPSVGSHGHPEFCRQLCLFFAGGTCNNKKSCGYCHCEHEQRVTHLDRRNRELLLSMAALDRLELLLPLLEQRLESKGLREVAGELLQTLQEALQELRATSGQDRPEDSEEPAPKPQISKVKSGVRKMPCISILGWAVRASPVYLSGLPGDSADNQDGLGGDQALQSPFSQATDQRVTDALNQLRAGAQIHGCRNAADRRGHLYL
ncbi:unnamed protein product [Polarella glacialis]|uniref:C3H1-type domain-containing protein n=1 Tax=Polarella glacialis TaxID=89957 RepID=A0A813G092_POLGL|nr:unnamed protein product [Polarella glacialis]CAE8741634.1 unnamed protein product [Polarella glacialis]